MAKQYTIENVEGLRKKINRDFLIRLTFPKERKRIVVGFTRFCEIVGNLHAEHYCNKALKSLHHAPQFKGQSGRLIVTFTHAKASDYECAKRVKERVITAATVIGIIIAGMVFWKLVAAFMWACYYAGIPM